MRTSTLLSGLARESRIIEIGPSYNPLVPKADGWDTFVIDHADRAGLIDKYADNPTVDTSKIEEVDFVWVGGPLSAAVPADQHGTFGAFIASHVIEHTTDVVEFLLSAQQLISDDGVVILAIPDKRKCFDAFRPLSTTGDAVVAYRERRSRHTAKIHFDYGAHMTDKGQAGWAIDDTRPVRLAVPFGSTLEFMERANESAYVDAHQWVFVPASFELMMLELAEMGLIDLRVERVEEAHETEFYAWLRKGHHPIARETMEARRVALMQRIVVELAEQSRQVPDSPLVVAEREVLHLKAVLEARGLGTVIRERLRQLLKARM